MEALGYVPFNLFDFFLVFPGTKLNNMNTYYTEIYEKYRKITLIFVEICEE